MNYKLRKNFTTNAQEALYEILEERGVENVEEYLHPTEACECDPFLLDNIQEGIKMLHKHLEMKSKILFVVDSD